MAKLTVDKLNLKGKRVLMRVDFNVPLDEAGKVIPVASLWADTTAVLVFVRHFG